MSFERWGRLLHRLRTRGVLRVAASYAVIAWLLLQIADVTLEPMGAPPWTMRLLITLVLCGFPVAILLAWFFELTPAGPQLDRDPEDARRPRVRGVRRYADALVIGVLSLAVVYLLLRESSWIETAPLPVEASVAIVPFRTPGEDPDAEFLGVGLAGDLRDRLARVAGLRVVASTSSFQFAEMAGDVREVANKLGVAAVLEGEIRRSRERLLVSAQLLSGEDARVLWSGTFDREASALAALPPEIVREVAAALLPGQVLAGGGGTAGGTTVVSAQELFLLARYLEGPNSTRRTPETARVRDLYAQAIAADPGFADAHAALGRAELVLNADLAGTDPERLDALVLPHLDRALALDPASSEAYVTKGMLRRWTVRPGGDVFYRLAVEVGGNNALAHHNLAHWEFVNKRFDKALDLLARARELDPMTRVAHQRYFETLVALGRGEELRPVADRMAILFPDDPGVAALGCSVDRWNGDVDSSLACLGLLQARYPDDPSVAWAIAEDCKTLGLADCYRAVLEPLAAADDWKAALELALLADDRDAVRAILEGAGVTGPFAGMLALAAMDAELRDLARSLFEISGIEDAIRDDGLVFHTSADVLLGLVELDQQDGRLAEAGRHLDVLLNWTARYEEAGARAWWLMAQRAEVLVMAGRHEEALLQFERAAGAFGLPCEPDYLEFLETDPQFEPLRGDPRFAAFPAAVRALHAENLARLPHTLTARDARLPGM